MKKKPFFSLKKGPLGGSRGREYAYRTPLVGCTVKTNTTDIQTVDSDYSKTIHREMEEDHKTKEARDEGVEKHSCQIELRGIHLKLVYYNGKQVLCEYIMVHVTVVLHVSICGSLPGGYTKNFFFKKKWPDVRPDERLTSGVRRQPHPT